MSHWWRAHDEAIDDPKLCLLSDRAHRAWFNLCCLTSASGGTLPAMKVIELKLRMAPARVAAVFAELKEADLIDEDETGMRPHNWNRRQFKSDVSTERVQQLRERRRNVSSAVSETPPERQIAEEQIAETEKQESSLRSESSGKRPDRYPEDFENQFWKPYPRTPVMSKKEALSAWRKLTPEDRNAAIAAVSRFRAFLASKPDHPAVHACRFLSQRRFDGFGAGETISTDGMPADLTPAQIEDWKGGWRPGMLSSEGIREQIKQQRDQEVGQFEAGCLQQTSSGARPGEGLVRGETEHEGGGQGMGKIFPGNGGHSGGFHDDATRQGSDFYGAGSMAMVVRSKRDT